MKTITILGIFLFIVSCENQPPKNIEEITKQSQQDSLFRSLMAVTQYQIPESVRQDSLSFLILPVQASCPSCRKKTIDSIMKNYTTLTPKQYIIIAANGGRKTMRSFFKEQNYELPILPNGQQITLDSLNLSFKHRLCKDKPTVFYTYDQRAYQKIESIPSTVKNDLSNFFSGHRPLIK